MARRITVRAVIRKDDEMLLARLHGKDYWCTIGGGLDEKEAVIDGLRREIIEETGVEPQIGKLLYVQQYSCDKQGYNEELEFFFEVTNAEDFINIDLSKTTHGLQEIAEIAFVDPTKVEVLPEFLRYSQKTTSEQARFFSYL